MTVQYKLLGCPNMNFKMRKIYYHFLHIKSVFWHFPLILKNHDQWFFNLNVFYHFMLCHANICYARKLFFKSKRVAKKTLDNNTSRILEPLQESTFANTAISNGSYSWNKMMTLGKKRVYESFKRQPNKMVNTISQFSQFVSFCWRIVWCWPFCQVGA